VAVAVTVAVGEVAVVNEKKIDCMDRPPGPEQMAVACREVVVS